MWRSPSSSATPVDELAVDLDRLDREALDVVQRRVAGAEVVEHQPHAEALEVLQHGGRRGALLHQDALGQLEPQALGRHAGLAQDGGELVGQRGLRELAAGEVDGQAGKVDRGVGGPARELAAGLAQHPAPERDDQPALLGDGDERAGEHDALARVAPAHERLDPDDPALVEVDERLVVELELVALERVAEVVLELEALGHAPADGGVEELVARAAVVLGALHRGVGVAHERLGVVAAPVGDGDADAGADDDGSVAEHDRRGERVEQPLGDLDRAALAGQALAEDGELVAAEARERVAAARAAPRAARRARSAARRRARGRGGR